MTASQRRAVIATAALAGGLAAAPSAFGATAPFALQAGAFDPQRSADLQAFYPRKAVVREGDSLTIRFGGFHTAVFPARGAKVPEPVVPAGTPTPPTNDPAGAPYWFAGLPQLQINPPAFTPSANRVVNGRRTVNSGVPQGNPATARFVVKFAKRGSYRVQCALHPKMRGTVTVLPKNGRPPSGAAQKRRAAAQLAADRKAVRRVLRLARRATQDAPLVQVGPGTSRIGVFAFVPANRTVAPGTELNFRMAGRNEIHTVTFGPSPYLDALQAASLEGPPGQPMASEAVYPSDPPGTTPALSPSSHGNGFLNSGVLTDPGIPGPKSFRIRFDTPGQYEYRCLVHPFMRGKITVA